LPLYLFSPEARLERLNLIDGRYDVWTRGLSALGGMNRDRLTRLPAGNWLVTGDMQLWGQERGAVLLGPEGEILALAMLTDQTYRRGRWDLDIFAVRSAAGLKWARILRDWGKREMADFPTRFRQEEMIPIIGPIRKTRLHWVVPQ
jgi:hypothetical protein